MKKLFLALLFIALCSPVFAFPPPVTPPASSGSLDESGNYTLTGTWNFTGATGVYPCVTASDCSTYTTAGMCCVDSDDWKMYLGTGSGVSYVGYDASGLNSGTVSTNRYSAYADLVAESKIGSDSTILTSASAYSDIVSKWATGSCSGYLKSDGTCDTPGGTGDVTGVGDCSDGACLDGTSDGGTYIRLYDGNSHYTQLSPGDSSANLTFTFPTAYPAATYILTSTDAGVLGYLDPATKANLTGATFTGGVTLDDGSGDSPSLTFTDETNETAAFTKTDSGYLGLTTVSADGLNIITGNLKVGNGSPGQTIDGEDAYIEGLLEVDGVIYADGGLTGTASNASALGNKTWAAPDAIGSSTPAAGTFTNLTSNGIFDFNGDSNSKVATFDQTTNIDGGPVSLNVVAITSSVTDSTAHNLTGSVLVVKNNNTIDAGGTDSQLNAQFITGNAPSWTHAAAGDVGMEGDLEVDGVIYADGGVTLGGALAVGAQEIQSSGNVVIQLGDNAGTNSFEIEDSDSATVFSVDSNGVMGGISAFVPPYTADAPTAYQLKWDTDFLTSRAALCGHDNTGVVCFAGSTTAPSADGQFLIFDNDTKAYVPHAMSVDATMADSGAVTVTGATADFSVGDDLSLASDAAVLNFGADNDVNFTHVADKGLVLSAPTDTGTTLNIKSTDADLAGATSLLDLSYNDDGSANGYFLRGYDNAYTDLKFSIGADGAISAGAITSNSTITAAAADDPAIYFDPSTASESEWWIGTNNDSGGDDNDNFEIRQSATPGTNVEFKVEPDGDITSTGDLTVTGADITLAAAGVKLTGSNGSLTILGLGDGQDEDVKIDLNTTENTIEITSPASSATAIDINTLNLVTTGTILGAVNVVVTTDGTESPTAAQMYGTMFIADNATAANDTDYTLPAAAAGMTACFYDNGGGTGGIIIDPDASDEILLDGTGVGAGDAIDSPGVAGDGANGDYICLMAIDSTYWITLGRSGTWVDGGAD